MLAKFTIEEIYNAADLLGYSSSSVDRRTRYGNFINQHGVIVRGKLRTLRQLDLTDSSEQMTAFDKRKWLVLVDLWRDSISLDRAEELLREIADAEKDAK